MQRHLSMEMVRVTEAAALASAKLMGLGDEKAADAAAVEAMREEFNYVDIHGTVVIGEGERDEAPMLFIGEEVGRMAETSVRVDIAVDPLEGTTIAARGDNNALSVAAIAPNGNLLHAPDTYMQKIAAMYGGKLFRRAAAMRAPPPANERPRSGPQREPCGGSPENFSTGRCCGLRYTGVQDVA